MSVRRKLTGRTLGPSRLLGASGIEFGGATFASASATSVNIANVTAGAPGDIIMVVSTRQAGNWSGTGPTASGLTFETVYNTDLTSPRVHYAIAPDTTPRNITSDVGAAVSYMASCAIILRGVNASEIVDAAATVESGSVSSSAPYVVGGAVTSSPGAWSFVAAEAADDHSLNQATSGWVTLDRQNVASNLSFIVAARHMVDAGDPGALTITAGLSGADPLRLTKFALRALQG